MAPSNHTVLPADTSDPGEGAAAAPAGWPPVILPAGAAGSFLSLSALPDSSNATVIRLTRHRLSIVGAITRFGRR